MLQVKSIAEFRDCSLYTTIPDVRSCCSCY